LHRAITVLTFWLCAEAPTKACTVHMLAQLQQIHAIIQLRQLLVLCLHASCSFLLLLHPPELWHTPRVVLHQLPFNGAPKVPL
jgi:hypothetical protein